MPQEASTQRHYTVTRAELPICCPQPDMRLWDSHPRVYLPIEATGEATCPYCNAKFSLVDTNV
jgi:uncharacterized Zn-finger protein